MVGARNLFESSLYIYDFGDSWKHGIVLEKQVGGEYVHEPDWNYRARVSRI
jgi:hypothetical protein